MWSLCACLRKILGLTVQLTDNATDGGSLTLPVFLLEASHGAAPAGAELAYAVLPGVGPASGASAAVTAFEAAAKVVANTAAAQAVLAAPRAGEEALMVAAWPSPTPTTVDGGKPGTKVTVTKPATGCLLTVTTTGAATTFAASDPTNSADGTTVEFTVSRAPDSFPAVDHLRAVNRLTRRWRSSCPATTRRARAR